MNFQYVHYHNIRIPMRDGITLAADLYLPDAPGPFTTVLSRSPYGGTSALQDTTHCKNGRAVLWVDCRGRFLSDGKCVPAQSEIEDGYDTLEWIAQQTWSNGKAVMVGGSYPAQTQLAAAASGHPALAAAAPSAISVNMYDAYYTNGVLELSFMPSWFIGMCSRDIKPPVPPNFKELIKDLPVCNLGDRAGMPCPPWEWIAHNPDPGKDFWQKIDLRKYAKKLNTPFFIQGSYFDLLGRTTPQIYTDLMTNPDTPEHFKKYTFMRLGPWGHGVNVQEGEYTYGEESMATEEPELDFLFSLTEGKDPKNMKKIQYFTMGENKWHETDVWPIEGTTETPFYLNSRGNANTAKGDGCLTREAPACDLPADSFAYDPMNPVPTCGGRMVGCGGQRCQSEVEARKDVLIYTTPPLAEDLTVTGNIRARLFVQSSAPDTDFTVKLVDVQADGRPLNVCDTIYRMRYRNGFSNPEMMQADQIYCVEFPVDYTSYQFKKGHAVRVEISSSNFPHYERNLNTEELPSVGTVWNIAEQKVHHSPGTASCIILPVENFCKK